jgi:hypothetical protein
MKNQNHDTDLSAGLRASAPPRQIQSLGHLRHPAFLSDQRRIWPSPRAARLKLCCPTAMHRRVA